MLDECCKKQSSQPINPNPGIAKSEVVDFEVNHLNFDQFRSSAVTADKLNQPTTVVIYSGVEHKKLNFNSNQLKEKTFKFLIHTGALT